MIEYKNFVILENENFFEITTKENFNRLYQNGNFIWKMYKKNGFENIEQVKEYLNKYFIK